MMRQITVLFTLFLGLVALAGPPPLQFPELCWQENGKNIADGEFTVTVKTDPLSKDELLQTLQTLGSNLYVQPQRYPWINTELNTVSITLKATIKPANESREQYKARVNAIVRELAKLPAVSFSCIFNLVPHPSTTGSN